MAWTSSCSDREKKHRYICWTEQADLNLTMKAVQMPSALSMSIDVKLSPIQTNTTNGLYHHHAPPHVNNPVRIHPTPMTYPENRNFPSHTMPCQVISTP